MLFAEIKLRRRLGRDDIEAAVLGGLLLSAGGSGSSGLLRNRAIGEMALSFSGVDLVDAREHAPSALVIVATGIGAPSTSAPRTEPRNGIESARLLLQYIGKPVAAVIPAHVPGLNAWLQASVLGLDLLDVAANGRGHPTIRLGSMGLAMRPDITITQVAVGGRRGEMPVSIVATGDFASTSNIMHAAAAANRGLILASRGPITFEYTSRFGALGALSYQIGLGHAMIAARNGGEGVALAAARFVGGEVLVIGRVIRNSVARKGAFDVGVIAIDGGQRIELGVCNEYMFVERRRERIYAFPDLIATLDPNSGLGLEISELRVGVDVAVIVSKKDNLPLGAGVLDDGAYHEIEQAMGMPFRISAEAPKN